MNFNSLIGDVDNQKLKKKDEHPDKEPGAEGSRAGETQDVYMEEDDACTVSLEETVGASDDAAGAGLDIAPVPEADLLSDNAWEAAPQAEEGLSPEVVEQDPAEDEELVGYNYATWSALQEAINNANNGDTIPLDTSLKAGPTDEVLRIPEGKTVTLDLAGYTLDRNLRTQDDDGHVIEVLEGATFTLTDSSADGSSEGTGTLKGGFGKNGGAVNVHNGATMHMEGGTITENSSVNGGGVCNKGSFVMEGGRITGNESENGGGIWTEGDVTLEAGVIDANTATVEGGGIWSDGDVTLQGGIINNNTAEDGGGVFVEAGTITIFDTAEITNNTVTVEDGGGIYNDGGTLTITGGAITNNTAVDGGGIFIEAGTVEINEEFGEVSIDGNESTEQDGGGIVNKGELTISDGVVISRNVAKRNGGGIWTNDTLNLYGGTITENDVDGDGSGIYYDSGSLHIKGNPVVTDNEETNVYISKGKKLTIDGALGADAEVGITMGDPDVFTSGLKGEGVASFTSDEDAYKVGLTEKDETELVEAAACTVTLKPGDAPGQMITESVKEGSKYFLPECGYEAPEGKAFAGWKDSDDGIVYDANEEILIGDDKIFEAQWDVIGDNAIIQSANVLFDGMIRIRLKYTIPESILDSGRIVFEKSGKETTIPLSDGEFMDGFYSYDLNVPIPEYADEVTARLVDGDGNPITVLSSSGMDYTDGFTYSVKQYAENKKKNGSTAEILAKALYLYYVAATDYFEN